MTLTGHRLGLIALVSVGVLTVIGIVSAETASNSVPPSRMGQSTYAIGPNEWKPDACSGIVLTSIVVGSGTGTLNGTKNNDLILGVPGAQTINGQQGNDCLVGNAGVHTLDGGPGSDVCIGPPGVTFTRCEVTVIR